MKNSKDCRYLRSLLEKLFISLEEFSIIEKHFYVKSLNFLKFQRFYKNNCGIYQVYEIFLNENPYTNNKSYYIYVGEQNKIRK